MAELNLIGDDPERTIERLAALGLSAGAARRLLAARVGRGEPDLERLTEAPRELRERIQAATVVPRLALAERRVDPDDGFAKYLFALEDDLTVEAVRIPLKPGADGAQRFTVCLSSEAGCAMGCRFCATAALGLRRRLAPFEMVAQLMAVRAEAPGRVSGAIFMGMGEPLGNLDAVMTAIRVITHPVGLAIGGERITVSTVGLVPEIRRFTAARRSERLAVSLFSAIDETRRAWIPIARKYGLAELRSALEEHCASGGRPLVAIVLIGGVNCSPEEAGAVAAFCRGLRVTIDLIPVNDSTGRLRPPGEAELDAYVDVLREAGRPIQMRYSGGRAIEGGCGMLASTRAGGRPVPRDLAVLPHPRAGAGPLDDLTYLGA